MDYGSLRTRDWLTLHSLNSSPYLKQARLFAKQPAHSPQDAVLLRVVGVVFARDLENGGECLGICIDPVPYLIGNLWRTSLANRTSNSERLAHGAGAGAGADVTDMLVDQNYPNVLPFRCKPLERRLDGGGLCLCVDYQKVLLVVWRRGNMLSSKVSAGCERTEEVPR